MLYPHRITEKLTTLTSSSMYAHSSLGDRSYCLQVPEGYTERFAFVFATAWLKGKGKGRTLVIAPLQACFLL